MAGRRETDALKPIDEAIVRMVSESPGRNESERRGSPDNLRHPEAEQLLALRRPQAPPQSDWRDGCPPAGWERQHGDEDTSSHWRSPPHPAVKAADACRPYNQRTWEVG